MKSIEAKEQVNLGCLRAAQLALSGMMYRFFRSGVTAATLCLAVAFLVHTLTHGLLAQSSTYQAYQELQGHRESGRVMRRLSRPDAPSAIVEAFVERNSYRIREYESWGELSEEQLERGENIADRVYAAERHFDGLPEDRRAILVGDVDIMQLLREFGRRARFELFADRVQQLEEDYPLDGEADFRRLVNEEWPWFRDIIETIRNGQEEAISRVRDTYPDRDIREVLITQPEDLPETLQQAGFETEDVDLDDLAVFTARTQAREALESMLAVRRVQVPLIERVGVPSHELSTRAVFQWLLSRRGDAEWLSELLGASGVEISPRRLVDLAEFFVRTERLQEIVGTDPPVEELGVFSMEGYLAWLIVLAFLVCVVGVANAMLMSVTERFTEIATMKCLGALDGFVMMMFVIEASIQGFVGGIGGIVLGIALAFMRGYAEFGAMLSVTPEVWIQILISASLAMVAGIVLASLAAIGPSLVAARLAPMEAMRVE